MPQVSTAIEEPTVSQPEALRLVAKRKYKIVWNKARCLECDETVESKYALEIRQCGCGQLSVGGGKKKLIRHPAGAQYEEKSRISFQINDLRPARMTS